VAIPGGAVTEAAILKQRFDLIIFDCDGVVVDSEAIGNRVFAEMLGELGLTFSDEEFHERFLGRSLADSLNICAALLGNAVPDAAVARYKTTRDRALREEVKAVDGVRDLLERLDLRYCIASSGGHDKMQATLGATGLLPLFEGRLFSATEVPRAKPAPDVFLHAAARMGAEPSSCLVVEDTVHGVAAGCAAGMTVFGFAGLTRAEKLRAAGAEQTFTHMRGLSRLLGLG
jgi:HAD superfamily hydrolase (TIGR01509 family)